MVREAPELTMELSDRTVIAMAREADWPDITIHRRCIEARNRRRLETRDKLLCRIDEVLKATA